MKLSVSLTLLLQPVHFHSMEPYAGWIKGLINHRALLQRRWTRHIILGTLTGSPVSKAWQMPADTKMWSWRTESLQFLTPGEFKLLCLREIPYLLQCQCPSVKDHLGPLTLYQKLKPDVFLLSYIYQIHISWWTGLRVGVAYRYIK